MAKGPDRGQPIQGTERLNWDGDLSAKLVSKVDTFLLREIEKSVEARTTYWSRDTSSPEAYTASVESQRERFRFLLGARDAVVKEPKLRILQPVNSQWTSLGAGQGFEVFNVEWDAFERVRARGLLLRPTTKPTAHVVAIPDCTQTPEQLVGLEPGIPRDQQFARRLASAGCQVIVPVVINRDQGDFDWGPRPNPPVTNRELLYRSAFELGRGLLAYEVQSVLSAAKCMQLASPHDKLPTGLIGWGDGGHVAFYASALSPDIQATCVSGYFGSRQTIWQEPIDRNVFGLLREFGDAEIATLIAPRKLIVEASEWRESRYGNGNGAPAVLTSPKDVKAETERTRKLTGRLSSFISHVEPKDPTAYGDERTLQQFLSNLGVSGNTTSQQPASYTHSDYRIDARLRHRAQMRAYDDHTQRVLRDCANTRTFFRQVNTQNIEAYRDSTKPLREQFYDEVIGRWDYELVAPRPRTRLTYETETWRGYEVVLDVFEEVFAYGILLVPKNLKPGEQRPVVVCQHGLEGRPQDTIGEQSAHYYAGFAGKLAERGYITFAPQNLYIGRHSFRTLQRKSYPLQKTLFSIIVPQHQQIVDWLQSLEFVDGDRVAFYGLSYGGKTAMRVPPLVTDYCLSICSADFNEWVDKNASTTNPRSYVWTGEYEIFEFNLGSTFNYAEMAGLIAPRPFMVERGHGDGVADDWTVAWEFAKVRNLYAARLKIPERCEIEWFDGPHRINGQATFRFLDRWLRDTDADNAHAETSKLNAQESRD